MQYQVINEWLEIECSSLFYSTVQEFFDHLIPSKKYQHLLIQNKWILLDGNPVKRETELQGQTLSIRLYPETYYYEVKTSVEPEIIYEDELFLVVNKKAGMLVHDDGNHKLTLSDIVESYMARNYLLGSANPIHRLDVETQGMVVFSKSVIFQALIDQLLAKKQIKRDYIAFVEGRIEEGERIAIDAAIAKDRHNPKKQRVSKTGQNAKTVVHGIYAHNDYSVVKCELKTGRTHQIRVHLESIGHPILNDELYGRPSKKTENMGLVANHLEFYHPLKEDVIKLDCDMSYDLRKIYY